MRDREGTVEKPRIFRFPTERLPCRALNWARLVCFLSGRFAVPSTGVHESAPLFYPRYNNEGNVCDERVFDRLCVDGLFFTVTVWVSKEERWRDICFESFARLDVHWMGNRTGLVLYKRCRRTVTIL